MSRQLCLASFGLFTIFALFVAIGCDEPNDPDIPPQPYRLAAIYNAASPVMDISAAGDTVAIAMDYLGYDILNVSDLSAISVVDSLRFTDFGPVSQAVAIDAANSVVAFSSSDFANPNQIRDYARDTTISSFGATGVQDMQFYSRPDTADFWFAQSGTDTRITNSRFARHDTVWSSVSSCPVWQPSGIGGTIRMENISIRSDGIVAVAFQAGVHLLDSKTCENLDTIATPGSAGGCAWFGDYLIVAAEYYMLLLDASDLLNLELVQQFEIRGADRLRQVTVDGNYAALLDTNDGIYIVDISNVASARLVQTITLIEPSSVAAANGRFYFGDRARGLLIYTR